MIAVTFLSPKRDLRIATTLLLLLSVLVTLPVNAATSLQLWAWRDSDVTLWRYISDHELIPNVSVTATVIAPESYEQVRQGAFQSLDQPLLPDIIQVHSGAHWLGPLLQQGLLSPLHQVDLSNQLAAGLPTVSGADGTVYGIPFGMQMSAVVFNQTVFSELGLDIPTSESEWTKLLKELDGAGVIPFYAAGSAGWWTSQVMHDALMAAQVPATVSQGLVAGTACFTDPTIVAALDALAPNFSACNCSAVAICFTE